MISGFLVNFDNSLNIVFKSFQIKTFEVLLLTKLIHIFKNVIDFNELYIYKKKLNKSFVDAFI